MTIVFLSVCAYFFIGVVVCFFVLRDVYKRQLAYQEKQSGISTAIISIVFWLLIGLFLGFVFTCSYLGGAIDKWFKNRYGEKK